MRGINSPNALKAALLGLLLAMLLAGGADAAPGSSVQAQNEAYRRALLELGERDQSMRTGLQACRPSADGSRRDCVLQMQAMDAQNFRSLHALMWARGWPFSSRVGDDAAFSAFLVIQHAELGTQAMALPAVSLAVLQNELRPAALALLTDRVRTRLGLRQLYGTQSIRSPMGPWYVRQPVEDPEGLQARRQALGLGPLR
jgi:hypothetical protein